MISSVRPAQATQQVQGHFLHTTRQDTLSQKKALHDFLSKQDHKLYKSLKLKQYQGKYL